MSLARTNPGWRGRCLLGQCGWGRLPGQCGTHRAARWMCTPGMVFGGYLVGMICGRSSLITLCARCKAGPPSSVRGACLMPRIAGPRASMARSSALAAHACFSALYQSPSSVTVLPFVCSSTPGSSWVQGPRWAPILRESNMLRPTDRHQTTTCQLYILLSMVEKENSIVCRPDHVGLRLNGR